MSEQGKRLNTEKSLASACKRNSVSWLIAMKVISLLVLFSFLVDWTYKRFWGGAHCKKIKHIRYIMCQKTCPVLPPVSGWAELWMLNLKLPSPWKQLKSQWRNLSSISEIQLVTSRRSKKGKAAKVGHCIRASIAGFIFLSFHSFFWPQISGQQQVHDMQCYIIVLYLHLSQSQWQFWFLKKEGDSHFWIVAQFKEIKA